MVLAVQSVVEMELAVRAVVEKELAVLAVVEMELVVLAAVEMGFAALAWVEMKKQLELAEVRLGVGQLEQQAILVLLVAVPTLSEENCYMCKDL